MFTSPPFVESHFDALPLRRFPQPYKQNVSNYTLTVNDVGLSQRICPVLPLGVGLNDRTTSHVRLLSQVVKYTCMSGYGATIYPTLPPGSPPPRGNAFRIAYIVDKQCGLMSGNGTWLPPSDNTSGGHLLGALPATPRMTTLACRNHENSSKFAFLFDQKKNITKVYNGNSTSSQGTISYQYDPSYEYDTLLVYSIDLDIQYSDDGTAFAGQVPLLSLCTDTSDNVTVQMTVSTVFIDHIV